MSTTSLAHKLPRTLAIGVLNALKSSPTTNSSSTTHAPSSVFADGSLQSYIAANLQDPWRGTPFEGYVYLSPKQKGEFGECFLEKYFQARGLEVKRAPTATDSYDRWVENGGKVEIKFSLAMRNKDGTGVCPNNFIINHVSKGKIFDRLVFCCINGSDESQWTIKWMQHGDFITHVESPESLFKHQQGGAAVANDDYMCSGAGITKLLQQSFVNDISSW